MSEKNTSTTPEKHDLVVTRIFDAPVEAVWKAWTDADYVKQWWGADGFTCPLAEMDVREGGASLVCMRSPEDHDMYNTWTYEHIVPEERLEFILHFTDEHGTVFNPTEMGMPPGIPRDVPHVITFNALSDGGTEITVMEYGYTSEQVVELSKAGLEQCLDKMATSLAGTQS